MPALVLTPLQLETAVPGTFGSILETLRHTVGADRSYLCVLSGGVLAEIDEASMDLPALREVMAATGPPGRPSSRATWTPRRSSCATVTTGPRAGAAHDPARPGIHHGTDHRSQVCTALTRLGMEPPDIDAWAFAWKDDRLTETQTGS